MLRRVPTFALATLLAIQGVLPCFGACAASATAPEIEVSSSSEVPACHATETTAPAEKKPAGPVCRSENADDCCCTVSPASIPSNASPIAPAVRDAASANLVLPVFAGTVLPVRHTPDSIPHKSTAPPGAPLFIAHHSLLI